MQLTPFFRIFFVSALLLTLLVGRASAEVKLPPLISSHMVLQRDIAVPIWGTAAADEKITVKFRDQEKSAVADKQGKWVVKLDAMKVGEPTAMIVTGTNRIELEDVVVGEVWVGSGQSNMAQPTSAYAGDGPLTKLVAEPNAQVRVATAKSAWQPASPASVRGFSALLFAFGVPLQKELNVPVGLIVGAVGGTPSGYWLTREMFTADAACVAAAKAADAPELVQERQNKYEQAMAKYKIDLAAFEAKTADAQKLAATQPTTTKPAPAARAPAKPVAPIAGGECYGVIGVLYEAHIKPIQPFAIRGVLWDQGESGTALEGINQYTTMGALIAGWRKAWGQGEFPFIYVQKPSGEGASWAAAKTPPLPPAVPVNGQSREEHVRIMNYPATAMVISSDLGGGIHPLSKSSYGERAMRVALGMVYGNSIEYYGPLYASHKIQDNKVRITFTHLGAGLACPEGQKLQGFAVAGDDKVFHWADAVIDGDAVVLSSTSVAKPTAVRYAWSQSHPWANLFNKDGIPAVEFRTDKW